MSFIERMPLDIRRELEKFQESVVRVNITDREGTGWDVAIYIQAYMIGEFFVFVSTLDVLRNFLDRRTNYLMQHSHKHPSIRRTKTGAWFIENESSYLYLTVPPELAEIITRALRRKL